MHNFTSEDLIQYVYKETSTDKTLAINAALEVDYTLREQLEAITGAQSQLKAISFSPSQRTLDAILNYAESKIEVSAQA